MTWAMRPITKRSMNKAAARRQKPARAGNTTALDIKERSIAVVTIGNLFARLRAEQDRAREARFQNPDLAWHRIFPGEPAAASGAPLVHAESDRPIAGVTSENEP